MFYLTQEIKLLLKKISYSPDFSQISGKSALFFKNGKLAEFVLMAPQSF